ncbi:MAG TPA: hypothetical protein VJ850_09005 [Candidatus Limnocylindrales bacterium]|nr:hypothetical protein [Candidatus Limnocylindrales bacterium]
MAHETDDMPETGTASVSATALRPATSKAGTSHLTSDDELTEDDKAVLALLGKKLAAEA